MINVHDCSRGSGKTTSVTNLLREDNALYCIVPMSEHKRFYPKEMQDRVISGNSYDFDFQLRGRKIKKVVIDECFMYNPRRMLELYYYLGKNQIDVVAYGTSQSS